MTHSETTRSDEELARASLAGSQECFVLLIRKYQHLVFGLCRNMLGCTDDAMDAAQDAFITAYRRLGELRHQADFKPWLRRIATDVCRQRLRARRTTNDLVEGLAWIDPYENVDQVIDLNQALAGLTPDTRLTVLLFYFEGSSLREIATFLGIPETTVMSRLRNARSQLRRDLQYMFEQPIKRSPLPEDFADRIPIPYDEYKPQPEVQNYQPISPWRKQWLLSAFPSGSTIITATIEGYDWEAIADRAVRVEIQIPDGSTKEVILRMSGRIDGIKTEAALLPVLASLGLPVPKLLAGPTIDPNFPDRGMLLATSAPLGQSALDWAVEGGTKAIDLACEVVMEAIERTKSITAGVEESPAAQLLERCSLQDELARVVSIGGPWMADSTFAGAVRLFQPIVAEIKDPLVFSDSGIGPNPRVDEDGTLVGFESFAWARFEDPHYQITKYWTYDCWPIRRAGFVERYLVHHNLTMRDFAPRLGVRALATLQREIPHTGGDDGYRNEMLGWLKLAVDSLSR